MVMATIRRFAIVVIIDRNAAIVIVMMMRVWTDLGGTMRGLMHCPGGHWHAHAQHKPGNGDQTQERQDE